MPQMRRENTRVIGNRIGRMTNAVETRAMPFRGLTEEQKAEKLKATLSAYEVWRTEREARKAARYRAMRSRNLS